MSHHLRIATGSPLRLDSVLRNARQVFLELLDLEESIVPLFVVKDVQYGGSFSDSEATELWRGSEWFFVFLHGHQYYYVELSCWCMADGIREEFGDEFRENMVSEEDYEVHTYVTIRASGHQGSLKMVVCAALGVAIARQTNNLIEDTSSIWNTTYEQDAESFLQSFKDQKTDIIEEAAQVLREYSMKLR